MLNGGRRIGIVQPAAAFDVRFDRAADGDLSRTQWGSVRRTKAGFPPKGRMAPPERSYGHVVAAAEAADDRIITTLRGAA